MKLLWLIELCLALIVGAVIYSIAIFPNTAELLHNYVAVTYRGKHVAPEIKIQKTRPENWVSLDEISKRAVGAIVVSEDWAFYTHDGYDLNQIRESMEKNIRLHKFARGGSTITQQVARNVYLSQEKSLIRKVRELFVAIALEKTLHKKRILELYLNIAEMGEGIYGIGPASRHYFGKAPSQLNAREGAFLAMLLPSPIKYSVSFRQHELTHYARVTMNSILVKMVQAQYLPAEELGTALAERLNFEAPAAAASTTTAKVPAEENITPEETPLDETVEDAASGDDSIGD